MESDWSPIGVRLEIDWRLIGDQSEFNLNSDMGRLFIQEVVIQREQKSLLILPSVNDFAVKQSQRG